MKSSALPGVPPDRGGLNALDFADEPDLSSEPREYKVPGEPELQSADYDKYLEEFFKKQRKKQIEEELPIFD